MAPSLNDSTIREYERIFEEVKEYIEENHASDIRLDEFCVLMDYSDRTVQRALEYHSTTWSYMLSRLRIIFASEAIMESDHPIADVARSVGYKSLTNFNRAFKKFWGASPRDFRKIYQEEK